MLSLYSSINFISAFALACFGLVIYTGSTSSDTKAFARYVAWVAIWAFSMGSLLYVNASEVSHEFIVNFVRYQYWLGIPITSTFFHFALVYRKNPHDYTLERNLLILLNIVLLAVYLVTGLVIQDVVIGPRIIDRVPQFGSMGFVLFNVIFALLTGGGLWVMFKKWRNEKVPDERRKNLYLFWSSVISFVPGVIFAILLPLTNNFESYWLAPTFTLAWVFYTSYVIFRHRVLTLKVLTGELLVFMLIGILFINIFLPS